jgi:integrase
MAGTVKHAKLDNRTARARLKGTEHWQALVAGRAHLGWRAGRWILRRYVDGKYTRATLGTADDKAEANGDTVLNYEQAVAAARAMLDRPTASSGRLTVRQAVANYATFKRQQGQSIDDYISRSSGYILPLLGDKVVAELTADGLRKWLATIAAMPAMKRSHGEQQYYPEPATEEKVRARRVSANRVLTMLKATLNYAYDEGLVETRDAWGRKLKPFKGVETARVRYLDLADAARLINAADDEFRPLVRAALETGARYGELCRLEISDFNANSGTLMIRRSKTGRVRHIILTTEGADFFRRHCAGRTGLMFVRADGTAWKTSNQAKPMREACARARINPPINFHALRHTWASHAAMNGVPLTVVARNLGHVNTRMVEKHYGHMAPSYIIDAIRAGAPKYAVVTEQKVVPLR